MVNFHNIWIGVAVEPETAGANAQGTWILIRNPENQTLPAFTDVVLNNETNNINIIACGIWSASNEAPFNMVPTQIKTSRNLNPGDELVILSIVTGITAGSASNRVMICAHTVRK